MSVSARFDTFLSKITLTETQFPDGVKKHRGVRNCLNRRYYNWNNDYANSRLVGSWAKSTEVRPPRDIDILFELPYLVYERFQQRTGNKQSQLLQEVKGVLAAEYPQTTGIKGDGPVVVIPFGTFRIELAPAFKSGNSYVIPITTNGGYYKAFDPDLEVNHVKNSDAATGGMTRHLIRMMKTWQRVCNVDIKSFWLELLAADFLAAWEHRGKGLTYYDWMVRDFFGYIKARTRSWVSVPGTIEMLYLGGRDWGSKAESAHSRAVRACDLEYKQAGGFEAGEEWQKIFGTDIPWWV